MKELSSFKPPFFLSVLCRWLGWDLFQTHTQTGWSGIQPEHWPYHPEELRTLPSAQVCPVNLCSWARPQLRSSCESKTFLPSNSEMTRTLCFLGIEFPVLFAAKPLKLNTSSLLKCVQHYSSYLLKTQKRSLTEHTFLIQFNYYSTRCYL